MDDAPRRGAPTGRGGPDVAQHTLATVVTLTGPGLHTGRRCRVTLHPAPAGHGRRVMAAGSAMAPAEMTWANRVPSIMSTSIALGDGHSLRTVEHLMAALAALGVDNVLVEAEGPEAPILDGSARLWCRRMQAAGLVAQDAPRAFLRVLRPVQVLREGGFLRAEPIGRTGFGPATADVTYDLLPDRPVKRWTGTIGRDVFLSQIVDARSFGRFDWRKRLHRPPARTATPQVAANRIDPEVPSDHAALMETLERSKAAVDPKAPALRGVWPGRATLVVGATVLPFPRYPDEPLRHVVLDMIGDLALAGAPLLGHIVAHNPSHEKTYLLVAALMQDRSAWERVTMDGAEQDLER